MESPIAIANFFIKKANSDGTSLTPMKLLKLVYLAHGWYLGLNNGEPLIPEAAEAWRYGPVIKSVYYAFKSFNNGQITSLKLDPYTNTYPLPQNEDIISFLNKIWEVYKQYTAYQLSALTHIKGSPWDTVWNQGEGKDYLGAIIPNGTITAYYKEKANL